MWKKTKVRQAVAHVCLQKIQPVPSVKEMKYRLVFAPFDCSYQYPCEREREKRERKREKGMCICVWMYVIESF